MNKKYINKFINNKYFNLPKGIIKSSLISKKFKYIKFSLEKAQPCIFVCNRNCEYDEYLIRSTIKSDYVVLKQSIIGKINRGTLTENEKQELVDCIKNLSNAFISIVVFPETQISIFGRTQIIPLAISEFLYNTGLNLHFINFVNSYFVKPIWSKNFRKTETFFNSKFIVSNKHLSQMSPEERNYKINMCMPSSSSVYVQKKGIQLNSSHLAVGFESIIYACPHCKQFFTFQSEFNNLRCTNCGVPFELTNSGMIYTNGKYTTLDNVDDFLYEIIFETSFGKKEIISYKNINLFVYLDEKIVHTLPNLTINIFENKVKIHSETFEKIIYYKDVIDFEFMSNNTLKLYLNGNEIISIKPSGVENIYIIFAILTKIKTQQL